MKKVLTIFLSVLMLATNMGLTIATHFCGGKAQKHYLAWGIQDEGCGMMENQDSCASDRPALNSKSCCDNEHFQIALDDEFDVSGEVPPPQLSPSTISLILTAVLKLPSPSIEHPKYLHYSPPLIQEDYPVLFQSFLV